MLRFAVLTSPMKLKLQRCLQSSSGHTHSQTHTHTHTYTLFLSLQHRCALVPTDVAMATSCLAALYNYVGYHDMVHKTKQRKYIPHPSSLSPLHLLYSFFLTFSSKFLLVREVDGLLSIFGIGVRGIGVWPVSVSEGWYAQLLSISLSVTIFTAKLFSSGHHHYSIMWHCSLHSELLALFCSRAQLRCRGYLLPPVYKPVPYRFLLSTCSNLIM